MTDTAARVSKILEEYLGVEPAKIKPDSLLGDDLGADSLDSIELVMACEEEFELAEIDDATAEKISTVQDMIDTVERLLQDKAA